MSFAQHLEWKFRDDLTLIRRAVTAVSPESSRAPTKSDRSDAYEMHPQHPLLRKLGFPAGYPGGMVYCPSLQTAFWGEDAPDAWRILNELDEILARRRDV